MIAPLFDTLGWALLIALCARGWRGRPRRALMLAGGAALLLWLPLPWMASNLIGVLRGGCSGLSAPSVVIPALWAWRRAGGRELFAGRESVWLAALLTGAGFAFYPAALGVGLTDPYAWGYDGATMALLTGGAAAWAWWRGYRVITAILLLALIGWRGGWFASVNLWDALIDPLAVIAGLIALARITGAAFLRRRADGAGSSAACPPAGSGNIQENGR